SLLERFRGCVEMTLRIIRVTGDAAQGTAREASRIDDKIRARTLRESGGPGTRFLEEKLRQAAHQEISNRQPQAILDFPDPRFQAVAKDSVTRLRPGAVLVADIAHLVERGRLDDYHDLFKSAATDRRDVTLSISGPWAPYSFAVFDNPARSRPFC